SRHRQLDELRQRIAARRRLSDRQPWRQRPPAEPCYRCPTAFPWSLTDPDPGPESGCPAQKSSCPVPCSWSRFRRHASPREQLSSRHISSSRIPCPEG